MGRKLLLDKAHVANIRSYDVYRREGGYRSVEKALKTMSPDAITEEVKKSGFCLLYTSPSPRDRQKSRMPSSA